MQNTPHDDKRFKRDELDQVRPKTDHDNHDDTVGHPDADTDGVTPVRQTERREDRASDDGMRPADRRDETGL